MPRVLVVHQGLALDEVEQVVAPNGEAALGLLQREWFDAVILALALEPLDGWCVLAALGTWDTRPRIIATVPERADIARAQSLGADLCVLAGTTVNARALQAACRRHPETSSPRPTPSGVTV